MARRLVGDAVVERAFAELWRAAKDGNDDDIPLSGTPWISVEALQQDDRILSYRITGHLEVDYGGDFTYDVFALPKGEVWDESFRH